MPLDGQHWRKEGGSQSSKRHIVLDAHRALKLLITFPLNRELLMLLSLME